jgi:Tfp pilus assembly protein FimT
MTMSPRKHAPAYTLVELMVVVLVLIIIAGVVVPTLVSGQDSQATAAARIVASDLETARSLAVTTLVPHSLVFNADLTAYKIVADYAGEEYGAAVPIDHPVKAGSEYAVTLASQTGMGSVQVAGADFGGATYVTFDAQGEPSAAGSITLAAGPFQVQVSVESLTGNITVAATSG